MRGCSNTFFPLALLVPYQPLVSLLSESDWPCGYFGLLHHLWESHLALLLEWPPSQLPYMHASRRDCVARRRGTSQCLGLRTDRGGFVGSGPRELRRHCKLTPDPFWSHHGLWLAALTIWSRLLFLYPGGLIPLSAHTTCAGSHKIVRASRARGQRWNRIENVANQAAKLYLKPRHTGFCRASNSKARARM